MAYFKMPEGQVCGISLNRGYKRIYNTSMPRQARKESVTGIFHVMMRGITHQNISDLRSSLLTLDNAQASLALYSLNRSLENARGTGLWHQLKQRV